MLTKTKETRSPLSAELQVELRACATTRHLSKNEMLCAHGAQPDAFFCVERGRLRVSITSSSGREAVIGMLAPGQWFGEVSLFIDAPHFYDTRAVVRTDLLVVAAADFHAIVRRQPAFLLELTKHICWRYRSALEWIDETILLPVSVRLARRLLAAQDLHLAMGRALDSAALRISQEDLSHMLGVSRQSVNRQLKDWEVKEILRLEYGSITLLDQDALRRLV